MELDDDALRVLLGYVDERYYAALAQTCATLRGALLALRDDAAPDQPFCTITPHGVALESATLTRWALSHEHAFERNATAFAFLAHRVAECGTLAQVEIVKAYSDSQIICSLWRTSTALMCAAARNARVEHRMAVVQFCNKWLAEWGATFIGQPWSDRMTDHIGDVCWAAATCGHQDVLSMVYQEHRYPLSSRPLMGAAFGGHVETLDWIISDILPLASNTLTRNTFLALSYAAVEGDRANVVEWVIRHEKMARGKLSKDEFFDMACRAATLGHLRMFKLAYDCSGCSEDGTVLGLFEVFVCALASGSLEICDMLWPEVDRRLIRCEAGRERWKGEPVSVASVKGSSQKYQSQWACGGAPRSAEAILLSVNDYAGGGYARGVGGSETTRRIWTQTDKAVRWLHQKAKGHPFREIIWDGDAVLRVAFQYRNIAVYTYLLHNERPALKRRLREHSESATAQYLAGYHLGPPGIYELSKWLNECLAVERRRDEEEEEERNNGNGRNEDGVEGDSR